MDLSLTSESAERTFLFGAGGAASWVLQGFRRAGIPVAGFLDDAAARIGTVSGLPVMAPDDPGLDPAVRGRSTVICAVMNPAVEESAIERRLIGLGWGNVSSLSRFGRAELKRSGRRCAMLDWTSLDSKQAELSKARSLLSDVQSREIFDAFIAFCRDLDDGGFPAISPHPYFPADLPRWPTALRMIDCGAFDGDSVAAAIRHGYSIESSLSFEPDPKSFAALTQRLKAIPGAMAWPCGVSDRTESRRFDAQGDTGSALNSSGALHVQCVALDDVVPHFAPNLIKLDIEGAEESALRGAAGLLTRFRPGLAVSVYHLPTDIWRIPTFLAEIYGKGAEYLLRRHSRTIADTVLYVLPRAS